MTSARSPGLNLVGSKESRESEPRDNSLAGLRGWAALNVFFTHVRDVFCNDLRTAVHLEVAPWGLAGRIIDGLYNILFNAGQFAVCTFWILSGYVLSLSYFQLRDSGQMDRVGPWLRRHAAGRYFRLFFPVLGVCVISAIIGNLGGFQNLRLSTELKGLSDTGRWFIDFHPGIRETLKFALVECPFFFQRNFNPPLWTISYELWGSLILFAVVAAFGSHRHRFWVYAAAGLVTLLMEPIYSSFIVGIFLADIRATQHTWRWHRWLWLPIAALTATFTSAEVWIFFQKDLVGSTCLLLVVLYGPAAIRRFLSTRFSVFLGDISYALYLLHYLLLCSLTAWLYFWMRDLQIGRPEAILYAALATVPPLFLASWLFYRYVDLPSTRFARAIGKRFS